MKTSVCEMYCHVCPEAEQLNIMNRLVAIFGCSEGHITVFCAAAPSAGRYKQIQHKVRLCFFTLTNIHPLLLEFSLLMDTRAAQFLL